MVLIPGEFKISRSLARVLRNTAYEVRIDTAFEQVMRGCAAPRNEQHGTWIDENMIKAYCALHRMGYAHSVEIWMSNTTPDDAQSSNPLSGKPEAGLMQLAGGLYGIAIGRMFYGESMFSKAANASKIALAHLARQLERWQFGMIDCQMNTPHLATLGAREISRNEFITQLQELIHCAPITDWQLDPDLFA